MATGMDTQHAGAPQDPCYRPELKQTDNLMGRSPPPEPAPPEPVLRPPEPFPPTYEIELKHRLYFEDKRWSIPAAGASYILTLSDGREIHDRLDSNGFASHATIQPGTCKVEYEPVIEQEIEQLQREITSTISM